MRASPTGAGHRSHRVAGGARAHKKVSVTLPADLLDQIRDRVGPGNLSGYVAEALEEHERRLALQELVLHLQDVHGPITDDEVDQELARWDAEIRTGGGSTGRSSLTARA